MQNHRSSGPWLVLQVHHYIPLSFAHKTLITRNILHSSGLLTLLVPSDTRACTWAFPSAWMLFCSFLSFRPQLKWHFLKGIPWPFKHASHSFFFFLFLPSLNLSLCTTSVIVWSWITSKMLHPCCIPRNWFLAHSRCLKIFIGKFCWIDYF